MLNRQTIPIDEINKIYGFDWAINDFLVSDENNPHKIINTAFRVDGFIIAICLQGIISLEINGVVNQGSKKNVFIAKPLQLIKLLNSTEDCRILLIVFSKRFIVSNGFAQQILDNLHFSRIDATPIVELNQSEAWSIEHQFKALWERVQETDHVFRKQVVVNLLLVLLHDFDALYRKYASVQHMHFTRSMHLTEQFTDLVQQHFREKHDVAFYAQALHVTPKYLSATVRQTLGKTASSVIVEAITIEARALIRLEKISVKEAAILLHFPDQSTFGKFFKRSVGMSPVEYRRQA